MENNTREGRHERFDRNRSRLRLLAFRMLGTVAEADDAVQEAWIRWERADLDALENPDAWLTTVTSRVCVDVLRARRSRHRVWDELRTHEHTRVPPVLDPEAEVLLAEAVGSALAVVLEALSPGERVAYVLHDLFQVSFGDVAAVLGRSEAAARQLASRARRRVRTWPERERPESARDREVVQAFFAATREGRLDALLEILSPAAGFHADEAGIRLGAAQSLRGNRAIAERFLRSPRATSFAYIDGRPGLVGLVEGKPRVILRFTVTHGKIAAIEFTADTGTIARLDIVLSR